MQDAFAYCAQVVRAADHDRFIASLFAPAERRGALYALYAFNSEVSRVREAAHGPLPGEIRLQWWSEVIGGGRREEARDNPVAASLLETIARHDLAPARLLDLVEAHRFDVYDEPMADLAEFETYANRTSSALFALAAQILAGAGAAAITTPAGIAFAVTGLLRAFPLHAARGQLYLPKELFDKHQVQLPDVFAGRSTPALRNAVAALRDFADRELRTAGEGIAALPPAAIPALLPVALVRPALRRLRRSNPFSPGEIPPWRRQWLMWRAARRPARIAG
jgi:15-cis-phytoene synthase